MRKFVNTILEVANQNSREYNLNQTKNEQLAVQRMRQTLAFGQALVENDHSLLGSIKAQLATLLEKQQVHTNKQLGEQSETARALVRETAELWKDALASLEHNTKSSKHCNAKISADTVSRTKKQAKNDGDIAKRQINRKYSDVKQRFNIAQV